jgi:hypothetical protein
LFARGEFESTFGGQVPLAPYLEEVAVHLLPAVGGPADKARYLIFGGIGENKWF